MNQYFNFKEHLQNKLGASYYVSNERNLDSNDGRINVIIKALSGNVFDDSASIPYQIEIFTTDPEKVMFDFSKLASENNNKSFVSISEEKMYNIVAFYTTPTIMESDIEYLDNHYSRLVVFANMFIMFDLANVGKVTIDGEELEILNGTISYVSEVHSERLSGRENNINNKRASSVNLTFTLVHKDNLFTRKLSQIRKGNLSGNTSFEVQIYLTNNNIETYQMIVNSHTLTWARSAMPSLNVSLMEGGLNAISKN